MFSVTNLAWDGLSGRTAQSLQRLAPLVACLSSLGWTIALVESNLALQCLPWCITFVVISFACVARLSGPKSSPSSLTSLGMAASQSSDSGSNNNLWQFACYSYLAFSFLLSGWFAFHALWKAPPLQARHEIHQIVDIQLISDKDAVDNHDILSATKQAENLRARHSDDTKTIQSPTPFTPRIRALRAQSPKTNPPPSPPVEKIDNQDPHETASTAAPAKPQLVQLPKPPKGFVNVFPQSTVGKLTNLKDPGTQIASKWSVKTFGKQSSQTQAASQSNMLEEVSPPEMVELLDNDGDKTALDVFQKGGHSKGGSGARSTLQEYLKDLHRRIKLAWSPPRGAQQIVEVVFRIRKDGRLASIELVKSSGIAANDTSAIKAITASAPFQPLPTDFQSDNLDIQYTFNYKVNELSEVVSERVQ